MSEFTELRRSVRVYDDIELLVELINKYKDMIAISGPKDLYLIKKAIWCVQDKGIIIVCGEV